MDDTQHIMYIPYRMLQVSEMDLSNDGNLMKEIIDKG